MIASLNGKCEAVKLLLDAGAVVDLASHDGLTALMMASPHGNAAVVICCWRLVPTPTYAAVMVSLPDGSFSEPATPKL